MILRQFIPSSFCLKCQGCCRFREEKTIWAPYKLKLKKVLDEYLCARFSPEENFCRNYDRRPLDCNLYPFLLVKKNGVLFLGLHKSCSFIAEKRYREEELKEYTRYLLQELKSKEALFFLGKNLDFAQDYREDAELLEALFLNKLSLKDKPFFDRYLLGGSEGARHQKTLRCLAPSLPTPSIYNFVNIFIWKELFDIYWIIIDKCLSVFYRDKVGMFMIFSPVGKINSSIIKGCFAIMDFYNQGSAVSRIENVVYENLNFFSLSDFKVKLSEKEFVYLRRDLVDLRGDKFKAKRAGYNYFSKSQKAKVCEYKEGIRFECLELYDLWKNKCGEKPVDEIYLQMLEDSAISFKTALENFNVLGLAGYVVKIGGKIRACSLGYSLNRETFCILFEICDLSFRGIAQFIFREFCRKLSKYKYINVMGSCGLKNLEIAKLSWRPHKEIDIYTVYPKLNNSITQ